MSDVNRDNLLDKNKDFGPAPVAVRRAVWNQIPVEALQRMYRWENAISPPMERIREMLLAQLREQVQR